MQMRQGFVGWFKTLNTKEKQLISLALVLTFIGLILIFDTLVPPSWKGRAETIGEIIDVKSMKGGSYGGGSTLYTVKFTTTEGVTVTGGYNASPAVLNSMRELSIIYKKSNPYDFYVYNPTKRLVGIVALIFGLSILGTYSLYLNERNKKLMNGVANAHS